MRPANVYGDLAEDGTRSTEERQLWATLAVAAATNRMARAIEKQNGSK